jgi:flavin reductase (DIM6/NTAB) family NADH-FMN oxidoreductase RutF
MTHPPDATPLNEGARFACVDGSQLDTETAYRLLVGCVVPRPVAWITTVSAAGIVNVAPFSSYNYVATSPPMLGINIARRASDGAMKDSARNILETREFVVNVATEATMEAMHLSAWEYGPDVSEAEALGLPLLASRHVRPPRIASTPVQMECRLDQAVLLGRGVNTLYIGEVVAFHLSDAVYDGRRVDAVRMRPVSRLGGPYYAGLGEIFLRPMLQRPPGGEGATDADDRPPALP